MLTRCLCRYNRMVCREEATEQQHAQKNFTLYASEFWEIAFWQSKLMFYNSSSHFTTLNYELIRTRSWESLIKTPSSVEGDVKGHLSDDIYGALCCCCWDARLPGTGESYVQPVQELLHLMCEGFGEQSIQRNIATADRGYGKPTFGDLSWRQGFSSISSIPNNYSFVYPTHLQDCRAWGQLEAIQSTVRRILVMIGVTRWRPGY